MEPKAVFQVEIDAPLFEQMHKRCKDTGVDFSALVQQSLAYFLGHESTAPITLNLSQELTLEQQCHQQIFKRQVDQMTPLQMAELLMEASRAIALQNNLIQQFVKSHVASDKSFTFKPSQGEN